VPPVVIDFMSGEEHFTDHTLPVYMALPPEMRGAFITRPWHHKSISVERSTRAGRGDAILAPSWGDLVRCRYTRRPAIFMEHGAGFRFQGHSYAGSPDRPNVVLYLCQNEIVAAANRHAHPDASVVVVGVPKMDPWYDKPGKPIGDPPLVVLAFHWDCHASPGTRSAIDHYPDAVSQLRDFASVCGWQFAAHSHPRIAPRVRKLCESAGVPFIDHLDTVFEKADLLIADATSAAYEFASLGRPVLSLNAPWYHDEPVRGIRFPDYIPGLVIEGSDELCEGAALALADPPELRLKRQIAVEAVYPVRGGSAKRAAQSIQDFIRSC
jgi:CDP-Glycerol:Poly(glycerophosphate) glycerophosphotransferase